MLTAMHLKRSKSLNQIKSLKSKIQEDEGCFVDLNLPTKSSRGYHKNFYSSVSSFDRTNAHQHRQSITSDRIKSLDLISSYSLNFLIDSLTIIKINEPKNSIKKKIDFLNSLPVEISLYILLKVSDDLQSILNCRAVSKSWRTLAEDPLLWRQIFQSQPNWKIKNNWKSSNQSKLTTAIDHQPTSNFFNPPSKIPGFSRQNSVESYHSIRSDNSQIARRLSQLIGETIEYPKIQAAHDPEPSVQSNHQEPSMVLDWLQMFRDRWILDLRWRQGKQISRSLKGHKDSIYCLQINGHHIITGSRDRTVKVWNIKSGQCIKTLAGHQGSVLCARFDSNIMLTGSSDCKVLKWNPVEDWKLEQELIGHQAGVLDLAFNDLWILSCSKDTTIKVWDRNNGKLIRTIVGHSGPVNSIELCFATHRLISGSGDSTMKLWDIETGLLIRTFEGHLRGLACIKLIESLSRVISGSNDETIKVWDLETGQCLNTLLGHEGLVRSLDVDVNERRLVSGGYDKTIKVWDFETGEMKLDFRKGERSLVFDVKIGLGEIYLVGPHPNLMILDFSYGLDCENFI
ncbi:hypothetical protein O181_046954 [Austropuccinia psidii MF-1]|uniref:F-box domain-containing protein n=1 Tax=Austropuccinia psidii MF-1 TaxID=1389203 RepID=A0A9Q3DQ41_9BASI|nr:hypothetical protein [Austropuccinia psidii MF-1]